MRVLFKVFGYLLFAVGCAFGSAALALNLLSEALAHGTPEPEVVLIMIMAALLGGVLGIKIFRIILLKTINRSPEQLSNT